MDNDKKTNIASNKLLNGLSEKELFEVCSLGKNKYFKPGDTIFKEGDSDQSLFLILRGSIKLTQNLNGQENDIAIIKNNDGLGSAAYVKDSIRVASATVLEPSTVMVVNKFAVDMLAPNVQQRINGNCGIMSSGNIGDHIDQDSKLIDQINYLSSSIRTFIHTNSDGYRKSALIRDVLNNVQSLPMYTNNLLMLLQDENVSSREVVDQAKLDPSLVGVILKTINSAYYGLRCKISDVQHAVTFLGFNQVYQIVVDHGIKSSMPDTPEFRELQCHSNVISIFAFELAKLSNKNKPVIQSTVGLLHDIGKSVIFLLKQKHEKLSILVELMDHARLGSMLLRKWNLPDVVYKSVEYQCFPEFLPPSEIPKEHREDVAILYVAHLCYEYSNGTKEEELPVPFFDEYVKLLHFPEKPFSQLFKETIMPTVHNKIKTYPENVRKFITESNSKIMQSTTTLADDLNIGDIF